MSEGQVPPGLLGCLLALELLNLSPLTLDLALLRADLTLLLLRGDFLVLQCVTDYVPGAGAERSTNSRSRTRSADGRADYCAGAGAEDASAQRAFLTRRQWLS